MQTYQYVYAVLALVIWIFGYLHTGRHLRPRWKVVGRMLFYFGASGLMTLWLGHFGIMFIVGFPVLGLVSHTLLCERHGIDWWSCEPVDRYVTVSGRWGGWDI